MCTFGITEQHNIFVTSLFHSGMKIANFAEKNECNFSFNFSSQWKTNIINSSDVSLDFVPCQNESMLSIAYKQGVWCSA